MCGFAGIVTAGAVDPADVQRMASTIAHRGPDDATVHVEPHVGLGFRRLSIIDLEGGRQPVGNEDGTIQVTLNGEIYNYKELRAELAARGHRFATHSDTEVIVHLYEEVGSRVVERLRGMFAFAVWDAHKRRLLLARDHLGQKPLFWARSGGRFLFASEIKAILAVAPELARLDPAGLHEYLSLRVIYEPRSMFAGVRKLPAGSLLEVDGGSPEDPTPRRYWKLSYEPKQRVTERDAVERLDEAVRESVRLHLVSDVEVGAFLSGGIDSGIVTAVMAQVGATDFKTFSAGTPYGAFDETPAARSVAQRYGTRHFEGWVHGDVLRLLPELILHLDEPSDPLSACLYVLAETAAREVKVALGGDGGDELFGGYDRYYGTRYADVYARLPRPLREGVLRRMLSLAPDGFWYKSFSNKLKWLDELASVEPERRYARSLSYFYFPPRLRDELYTDDFRRAVGSLDPEASIMAWQTDDGAREALDRMMLADSMVRLPNHPVMVLDRMTMAHGLEARSPFLDHRLAEFAATLPVDLKVRGSQRRYLQMRLAERYLPPEVLMRPKQGFSSALPYMMADQFRALFSRFLPDSHLVGAGLLRPDAIARLLQQHLSGKVDHGNRLWLLLNAELWHRIRIEGEDPAALTAAVEEAMGLGSRGASAAHARAAFASDPRS